MSYETNFFFRKDVLWKASSQLYNKGIKDKIAYYKKQVKKFGEIYSEVFGAMYENQGPKVCLAVLEDLTDKAICAKYGWKTIEDWRNEDIQKLRNDLKNIS